MKSLVALLFFVSSVCWAIPRTIISPVCAPVTTTILTGVGTLSLKVPGTFAGPADPTNVRYLKHIDIYSDTVGTGDFVDGLQLSDDDGVIPAPARAQFPDYPVIYNFSADTGVATGSKAGFYFDKAGEVHIDTLDGTFQPVPSGLYLKATVNNAGLLSKTYRFNIIWGKPA